MTDIGIVKFGGFIFKERFSVGENIFKFFDEGVDGLNHDVLANLRLVEFEEHHEEVVFRERLAVFNNLLDKVYGGGSK